MKPLEKLKQAIDYKRKEMVAVGMEKGLSHPETVKLSQELDDLLNQLMREEGRM